MDKKLTYLDQLEITRYVPRVDESAVVAEPSWFDLQQQVKSCQACSLCETRTQTVFGVGKLGVSLMLIGEAPGATEDQRGEPFVGQAGQLLDKMMAAIGQSRETVFITNMVKCRPPNNRNPLPLELEQCFPYLLQQIKQVKPKLILALGAVAAQNLLKTTASLKSLRGKTFQLGHDLVPLMVTYHPAYLLRNPADKRNAWVDLQRVQSFIDTCSLDEAQRNPG